MGEGRELHQRSTRASQVALILVSLCFVLSLIFASVKDKIVLVFCCPRLCRNPIMSIISFNIALSSTLCRRVLSLTVVVVFTSYLFV